MDKLQFNLISNQFQQPITFNTKMLNNISNSNISKKTDRDIYGRSSSSTDTNNSQLYFTDKVEINAEDLNEIAGDDKREIFLNAEKFNKFIAIAIKKQQTPDLNETKKAEREKIETAAELIKTKEKEAAEKAEEAETAAEETFTTTEKKENKLVEKKNKLKKYLRDGNDTRLDIQTIPVNSLAIIKDCVQYLDWELKKVTGNKTKYENIKKELEKEEPLIKYLLADNFYKDAVKPAAADPVITFDDLTLLYDYAAVYTAAVDAAADAFETKITDKITNAIDILNIISDEGEIDNTKVNILNEMLLLVEEIKELESSADIDANITKLQNMKIDIESIENINNKISKAKHEVASTELDYLIALGAPAPEVADVNAAAVNAAAVNAARLLAAKARIDLYKLQGEKILNQKYNDAVKAYYNSNKPANKKTYLKKMADNAKTAFDTFNTAAVDAVDAATAAVDAVDAAAAETAAEKVEKQVSEISQELATEIKTNTDARKKNITEAGIENKKAATLIANTQKKTALIAKKTEEDADLAEKKALYNADLTTDDKIEFNIILIAELIAFWNKIKTIAEKNLAPAPAAPAPAPAADAEIKKKERLHKNIEVIMKIFFPADTGAKSVFKYTSSKSYKICRSDLLKDNITGKQTSNTSSYSSSASNNGKLYTARVTLYLVDLKGSCIGSSCNAKGQELNAAFKTVTGIDLGLAPLPMGINEQAQPAIEKKLAELKKKSEDSSTLYNNLNLELASIIKEKEKLKADKNAGSPNILQKIVELEGKEKNIYNEKTYAFSTFTHDKNNYDSFKRQNGGGKQKRKSNKKLYIKNKKYTLKIYKKIINLKFKKNKRKFTRNIKKYKNKNKKPRFTRKKR